MLYARTCVYGGLALLAARLAWGWLQQWRLRRALALAARRTQANRQHNVQQVNQLILHTPESTRHRLQSLSFAQLQAELQSGSATALQVLHAYAEAAIKAHEKTNCVVGFVLDAFERAAELDATGDRSLPLFGMPFSVKESFYLAGHDSTLGYVHQLGHVQQQDALVVQALRAYGAVPFVRTNLPQSMLNYNCANPLYGLTTHPLNAGRTPGGSSGGEAALIALAGAPFGIGGDVGGSIRIPCHFSGVAGIKPGHSRVSQIGSRTSVPGRPMTSASLGPMALEAAVVERVLQLLVQSPVMLGGDPYMARVPWRPVPSRALTIGYYVDDGWFRAVPACERALLDAVAKLKHQGHTLVEFKPPSARQGVSLFTASVTVDGSAYIKRLIDKDIPEPNNAELYMLMAVPEWLRHAFINFLPGRMHDFFHRLCRTSAELRQVYEDIGDYRQQWVGRWQQAKLDALLLPANASVAMPHNLTSKVISTVSYTCIFNTLDFPAGVVPVSSVTEHDVARCAAEYPASDRWYRLIGQCNSAPDAVGLPVGLQVVALPQHEEMCTHVMKLLQDV